MMQLAWNAWLTQGAATQVYDQLLHAELKARRPVWTLSVIAVRGDQET